MKNIKEQVYEVLKKNILDGVYKPGERIQELLIAQELNVSRSPVREAIKELIGEGLLVNIPNKSITVKKVTEKEINDIFDFRNMTEKYAIERTIADMDDQKKAKLEEFKRTLTRLYEENDLHQYCKVDSELHRFLIESSGNQVLFDVVSNVLALIEQFRIVALSSAKRFEESVDEHVGIIDGILNKDAFVASTHCEKHLYRARQEIIKYLREKKVQEGNGKSTTPQQAAGYVGSARN